MGESYYLIEAYGTTTKDEYADARALFSDKDEALRVWKRAHELDVGARISVIEVDRERERKFLDEFIEDQAVFADVDTVPL